MPLARAWTIVCALCLLAVLSFLDRYIVALLAQPIMADLKISATDVGLLIGLGFGLLYAVSSVPLANLLDRRNRVPLVAGGVVLWSASTIASGFAPTFGILMMSRAGVAIGEAVLVPATVSLIGDMFAPHRRALPIGLFMATSTLMGGGSFLIGGLVLGWAQMAGPGLGMAPWRLTLTAIGGFGLIAALVWLAIAREPVRQRQPGEAMDISLADTLRWLATHARFFVPFYLAFSASAVASYGFLSWSTTILSRSHGLSTAVAGAHFGTIGMVAGGTAALVWPWLGNLRIRKRDISGAIGLVAGGLSIGNLCVLALIGVHSLWVTEILMALAIFGHGAAAALAVLIVQAVAPAAMRARLTSFYMLAGNFAGLIFGPPLVAWLSEHVFSGSDALRLALSVTAAVAAPCAAGLLVASARTVRSLPVNRSIDSQSMHK